MALMHIVSTTTPVSITTHGPTTPAAATAAAGAAFVRGSDELVRDLRGHVRELVVAESFVRRVLGWCGGRSREGLCGRYCPKELQVVF